MGVPAVAIEVGVHSFDVWRFVVWSISIVGLGVLIVFGLKWWEARLLAEAVRLEGLLIK